MKKLDEEFFTYLKISWNEDIYLKTKPPKYSFWAPSTRERCGQLVRHNAEYSLHFQLGHSPIETLEEIR